MYGLSGAHRSGKSTLAKAVAEKMQIHYFACSTTEIARAAGFDPVAPMSFMERVACQMAILHGYTKQLREAPRPAITDRTPLDMAAYMLAETTMLSDPNAGGAITKYVYDCCRLTAEQFDVVFLVNRLPGYTVEPGKPPANFAYQWKHELLLRGILSSANLESAVVATPDLDERVNLVTTVIGQRLEAIKEHLRDIRVH